MAACREAVTHKDGAARGALWATQLSRLTPLWWCLDSGVCAYVGLEADCSLSAAVDVANTS